MNQKDTLRALAANHDRLHGTSLLAALTPLQPADWLATVNDLEDAAETAGPECAEFRAAVAAFGEAAAEVAIQWRSREPKPPSGLDHPLGEKIEVGGHMFDPENTVADLVTALRLATKQRDAAIKAAREAGGAWDFVLDCWRFEEHWESVVAGTPEAAFANYRAALAAKTALDHSLGFDLSIDAQKFAPTDTLRSLVGHAQKLADQVRRARLYLDTRNPQTARAVLAE